ncbi:pyrroline-5-carboxylate reductase [Arcanobacterium pinnipediorum]|uniref:Pyrroline-5-carboxylate reductase n=1 Tax=Arcanobacterium pinnipediorum TaxID=1503041 RepID=A0ABY5AL23_9ACTO|nr:pyrroline-5-carboxylate reductase [Arcanobacterium pinnipediorum]USR79913.1 pyrroline-5-carboxylate reductase [Arcanobacterium pinnipediorum]
MTTLGFIGAGSMASAIMNGLVSSGTPGEQIIFSRRNADAGAQLATELRARFTTDNTEVAAASQILVLAVKPYLIGSVLDEISPHLSPDTLLVSVAAGVSLADIASHAPANQPIVRAMPNVNSHISMGMTGLCPNDFVSSTQFADVEALFGAIGEVATLPEHLFSAFSAIAGCSPAWTYTYIDALARAALAEGMTKREAVRVAAQAVLGSAQMVLDSLDSAVPAELVDRVTSPGGTTIAGLLAMEDAGFSPAVVAGVRAAVERDNA